MPSHIKLTLIKHIKELSEGNDIEPLISELQSLDLSKLEGLSERELEEVNNIIAEIISLVQAQKEDTIKMVEELVRKKNSLNTYKDSRER